MKYRNKKKLIGVVIIIMMGISAVFIKEAPSSFVVGSTTKISPAYIKDLLSYFCLSIFAYFWAWLLSVLIAIIFGSLLGVFSSFGIGRGRLTTGIRWITIIITDVLESMPKYIILLLTLSLCSSIKIFEGGYHLWYITAVLGLLNASKISRIVKTKIDSFVKREFIAANRALGIRRRRIIIHILWYNCFALIISCVCFQMIEVIVIEIGISYLQGALDWGEIVEETFGKMLFTVIEYMNWTGLIFSLIMTIGSLLTFIYLAEWINENFVYRNGSEVI